MIANDGLENLCKEAIMLFGGTVQLNNLPERTTITNTDISPNSWHLDQDYIARTFEYEAKYE
jgi:hypothetical protein